MITLFSHSIRHHVYRWFSKISKIHHPTWNKKSLSRLVCLDQWCNNAFLWRRWGCSKQSWSFSFIYLTCFCRFTFSTALHWHNLFFWGAASFTSIAEMAWLTLRYSMVVKIFQLTTRTRSYTIKLLVCNSLQFRKGFIMGKETNSSGKNCLLQWTTSAEQNLRGSAP